MYKEKHTLLICAYTLLMALFFCGGYAIGTGIDSFSDKTNPQTVSVSAVEENVSENQFELILDRSELFLYKKIGERRELLYSHPISESIFPQSDIEQLKQGVYFDNLSDAQSLLENFVS